MDLLDNYRVYKFEAKEYPNVSNFVHYKFHRETGLFSNQEYFEKYKNWYWMNVDFCPEAFNVAWVIDIGEDDQFLQGVLQEYFKAAAPVIKYFVEAEKFIKWVGRLAELKSYIKYKRLSWNSDSRIIRLLGTFCFEAWKEGLKPVKEKAKWVESGYEEYVKMENAYRAELEKRYLQSFISEFIPQNLGEVLSHKKLLSSLDEYMEANGDLALCRNFSMQRMAVNLAKFVRNNGLYRKNENNVWGEFRIIKK